MEIVENDFDYHRRDKGGDNDKQNNNKHHSIVWVNRGWVPMALVPGSDHNFTHRGPIEAAKVDAALKEAPKWSRPKGVVELTALLGGPERE